MTNIQDVFLTLANEGVKAMEAATKAHEAAVDDLRRNLVEAKADREEGRARVRKMKEEAARMIADALRMEEEIEDAYSVRHREILEATSDLKVMRSRPLAIGAAA